MEIEEEKARARSPVDDGEKGYDRRPLKLGGFKLLGLAFSTLGIIYSDIGTSSIASSALDRVTRRADG